MGSIGMSLAGLAIGYFMWDQRYIDEDMFMRAVLPAAGMLLFWGVMQKALDRA
jgi:hypothetical protein